MSVNSKSAVRRGLVIFRYNLRTHDNPGLRLMQQHVSTLDCVCVLEPALFAEPGVGSPPTRHGYRSRVGTHRRRFLWQAIADLNQQLEVRGSSLNLVTGPFLPTVSRLMSAGRYSHVAMVDHPGFYEQQQLQQLRRQFPKSEWLASEDFTLFPQRALPFASSALPESFSRFRKQVESLQPPSPVDVIGALPPSSDAVRTHHDGEAARQITQAFARWRAEPMTDESTGSMVGGETRALEHLNHYLHVSQAVRHYKETRNQLQGWDFSSKLSPWLAVGCLSPRMVWHEVLRHEQRYGRNDSTAWLLFELLWREYFQWMARFYGARLFSLRGIQNVNPLLTFYPETFMAWREGNTPSPFVNAFMRQLKATGWMSNRGRQIVASYLVNELGVDWRYGAAWFEEMLLDYDCGANWGNWQYLAGVGADPRGRRRFNIEKQQTQYDPDGEFVKTWAGSDDAQYLASFFR